MKTKLEIAHEWAMQAIDMGYVCETKTLVTDAWAYADAMQAEAEKREKEEQSEHVFEVFSEWQPDWSQAPDDKVQYFAVDESRQGGWYVTKPKLCFDHWYWSNWGERLDKYDHIPSFGYTGDWRESLRKRPK